MCGIAGLLVRGNEIVDAGLVSRMTACLAHRGPDDYGIWTEGHIALGHRRLAIRDVSPAGHQPMADSTGQVVVTYNGEIYNDRELREELVRDFGIRFRGHSDTELIPAGYMAWGFSLFERIKGMFSIALWDRRARRLVLARDAAGIKPLFVYDGGPRLLFASEIKALLMDGRVSRSLSVPNLHQYFASGYPPPDETLFEQIQQVPPGSWVSFTIEPACVRRNRFWAPTRTAELRTVDAAVEEFLPLWRQVVRDHLISDVPVGVLQSGGIDSTLVSLALGSSDAPLFTAAYADASHDETELAARVAAKLGARHVVTPVELSEETLSSALHDVVRQYDGQVCDEASIPLLQLTREVQRNVTVVLSGDGGDEFFAGYSTYKATRLSALLGPCLRGTPTAALGKQLYFRNPTDEGRLPWSSVASRFLLGASSKGVAHTQWRRLVPSFLALELYGPALGPLLGSDPLARYAQAYDAASGSVFDKSLIADQCFHLPGGLLWKSDAMSMAASLEMRVPFLDRRVMDFAARCSSTILAPTLGKSKRVLRAAAARLGAPKELLQAKKRGFNSPIARWLRTSLKEVAAHYLDLEAAKLYPWFEPQVVRRVWRDHRDRKANHAYALWPILHFAVWQSQLASESALQSEIPNACLQRGGVQVLESPTS